MRRLLTGLILLTVHTAHADDTDRKGLDFFESRIRPMLVSHCYECHSAGAAARGKLKAGLLLDSKEGTLKGGESGPAVVAGKPDDSLLIAALKHDGLEMPPKGQLPDEIVDHFVAWVKMGAPDPRVGGTVVASTEIDIEAGRSHWSFQPLQTQVPPAIDHAWIRTPVDQYVLQRQQQAQVEPNQTADPRTLVRRAYFDLTGLPPDREAVTAFVSAWEKDPQKAWTQLVDSLLNSQHYGERWARHWLDLTRFAESHGYAFDGDRPNAWHYRDFVIRALNADMPYDEFVRQQIAGDLLVDLNVQTPEQAKATVDTVAATGFLMAGPFTTQQTQKERERSRYEQLDDIVSTMGTSLLGLTVGCSRCHSHKFDPLPQSDYYRLTSCFAEVGSQDASINMKPAEFRKAKAAYDAALAPLLAARTEYETKTQPAEYATWIADQTRSGPQTDGTLTIHPWQHAGPFAGASFEIAFETAFEPEQQTKNNPAINLADTYADGAIKWTQQNWPDATIHNTLSGDNSANYLYRIIDAAEDRSITLSLGRDDALKFWLNGKELVSTKSTGGVVAGQEVVRGELKAGRNHVLMKIINQGGPSGFYFSADTAPAEQLPEFSAWQHLGPIQSTDLNTAYRTAYPPEQRVDLTAQFTDRGEPATAPEEAKLSWTPQPDWKDGVAHNDKLKGNHVANFLYRTVTATQPQVLELSLGSDDAIRVWINGRSVLAKEIARNNAAANQEKVRIQLAEGQNEILIKIVNGGGASGFYFAPTVSAAPDDVRAALALAEDKRNDKQKKRLVDWHRGFDLAWLERNSAVEFQQRYKPEPELMKVYAAKIKGGTYQFGGDTYKVYHLRRGNADNKEALAEPGFLQVLMNADTTEQQWLTKKKADGAEESLRGRLALTDWLTDTENGAGHLLARVIVNRLWHYHFGRGIVATPSDFGTRGERPSHPELLDWLAGELIRHGWKLKPIHRLIMTSSVYMQAGEVTESGRKNDPENLLLWRRASRRLEAEVIRDALLATSGTLDRTPFGKGTLDENSTRRSIYFTVKRSRLIPMLKLFDAPDAMQGIGNREESTVAPQALAMLNSPIIRKLATKFAERVRPNADKDLNSVIEDAWQTAFGRPPSPEEVAAMNAFVERQKSTRGEDGNAEAIAVRDFCHLVLCMNEFIYID